MAEIPLVDTHVHFWDRRAPELAGAYEWLDPNSDAGGDMRAIGSPRYLADDYLAETRFANVSKVVHVQAAIGIHDPVGETRWLQAFSDRLGVPHGIVAYVDLAAPDAGEMIDRHRSFANFRGVRDFSRADDYLTDPDWERGLALLSESGLVLCDAPAVEEMGTAAGVAARHEGLTYCVDHAGFPRRRDEDYFSEWRTGMRRMAAVASTVVKISGLGMGDPAWTVGSIRRWVLECIDAWGVERSFFGTNWPVDRMFSSFGDVIDAYAEIIGDLSRDEQERLFHRNAERVFRLA